MRCKQIACTSSNADQQDMPPTKRPLALTSSSRANIRDDDEDDERPAMTKVQTASPAGLIVKKRIVDDKENRTRLAGKKTVGERKASSSLTAMYDDDDGTIAMSF